jgi:hypothetical protein
MIPRRRTVAVAAVFLVALLAAAVPARAADDTTVVIATIRLPAKIVTNQCNGDIVNLHGNLTIVTAITRTSGGGSRQVSLSIAPDLVGEDVVNGSAYRAVEAEFTYALLAPAGFGPFVAVTWTLLVPQEGGAATVFVVTVLKETIQADGTITPTLERVYLVCGPRR